MAGIKSSRAVGESGVVYGIRGASADAGGASVERYLHAASALERDRMVREGFETGSGLSLIHM